MRKSKVLLHMELMEIVDEEQQSSRNDISFLQF